MISKKSVSPVRTASIKKISSRSPSGFDSNKTYKQTLKDISPGILKYREGLRKKLENYTILYQSGAPLKCLKHDNYFSLYNHFKNELVCVVCYNESMAKARNNKTNYHIQVTPLEKAYGSIQKSNEEMLRKITEQFDVLIKIENLLFQGYEKQTKAFTQYYSQLEDYNRKCVTLINELFDRKKKALTEIIEEERKKHHETIKQLKHLMRTIVDFTEILPRELFQDRESFQQYQPAPLSNIFYFKSLGDSLQKYEQAINQKLNSSKNIEKDKAHDTKVYQHVIFKQLYNTLKFSDRKWDWNESKHHNKVEEFRKLSEDKINRLLKALQQGILQKPKSLTPNKSQLKQFYTTSH